MKKKGGVLILNAGPPLFSVQDGKTSCKLSHTKVNLIAQVVLIVSSIALAFLILGPILISVLASAPNNNPDSESFHASNSRLNPKFNRHQQTRQHDIFISVKTTKKFHRSRLDVILDTWFQLAPRETWFFTDGHDKEVSEKTGTKNGAYFLTLFYNTIGFYFADNHLLVTGCSSDHSRQALCCKMAAEFEAFLESDKR